jgi:hypothetical protein
LARFQQAAWQLWLTTLVWLCVDADFGAYSACLLLVSSGREDVWAHMWWLWASEP